MTSEALTRAVAAYDEARCTMYGRKNEPRMSDRNRETIAPMIAAAVQAYICALPGWKFVPTNPTKAMMDAVDAAYDAFEAKPVGAWCGAASVYAAMLDAAPVLENGPAGLADATPNKGPSHV